MPEHFNIKADKEIPFHVVAMETLVSWDDMYEMCMERSCQGCPFDLVMYEGRRMCEAASTITVMRTVAAALRPHLKELRDQYLSLMP